MVACSFHDAGRHFEFSFLRAGIGVELLSEFLQVEPLEVVQEGKVLEFEGFLNKLMITLSLRIS
jgi:hypothetical protein